MQFCLQRRRILVLGILLLLVVNLGHAAAQVLLHFSPSGLADAVEALFDLDREGNLSTLYNALLILGAALLAALIALWRQDRDLPEWTAWSGIALIFSFLFVDELCALHDSLDFVLAERMNSSGALSWPWVIAYGVLTLFVAVVFLPFFFRLPRCFRFRFGMAAVLYVGGAIGLEMIAASQVAAIGGEGPAYPWLVAVEESLEMGAFLLVIDSLLQYLECECPGFAFRVETSPAKGAGAPAASRHLERPSPAKVPEAPV